MPQKTILISINSSWNIINFRRGLIQAFQETGYRVVALAPPDAWSARFRELGVDYYPIEMDSKGVSPRGDLKLLRDYRRALNHLKPDVYLGYTAKPNVWGSLAAQSLGIPVINNVSGLGTAFIRDSLLTRIVSSLYRFAFRRSTTIFFQNADDLDLFTRKRLVPTNRARLLPGSGIDLERYRPVPARDRAPLSFLLVSRLLWDKGVGEFIEAARIVKANHPDVQFQLLGFLGAANRTAVTKEQVQAWQDEGIVSYLGAADDVRPFIADAACVVLPSYREGLPRALLEGAAMAKPLVATDVPGCRDVVEDGVNGFLCSVRDARSLAEAMRRMIALSTDERARMGEAGRRLVEQRFDERLVRREYLAAVEQALALRR